MTPANSHGATFARVSAVPSTVEMIMAPCAVRALTQTSAQKKSSGGLTATASRSRGLVYQAAATLPITKLAPARTPH